MTVSDDDISSLIDNELLERRTKAMFLKNAGATLAKIAEETGVSIATVRKDLAIVRRDINNEPPMDVIARHRAVIFDIQRANYPAMLRGDKDAAMTILRALDRESRLLGLDQPVKMIAGVTNEEFANEAARLIERINALDPATLKELERASGHDPYIIDAETTEAPEAAADGAGGQPEPVAGSVAVLGPWRHGQPIGDPACEVSGAGGSRPGLPGQAGPAGPVHDAGHGQPAVPDDDDGWSNI